MTRTDEAQRIRSRLLLALGFTLALSGVALRRRSRFR